MRCVRDARSALRGRRCRSSRRPRARRPARTGPRGRTGGQRRLQLHTAEPLLQAARHGQDVVRAVVTEPGSRSCAGTSRRLSVLTDCPRVEVARNGTGAMLAALASARKASIEHLRLGSPPASRPPQPGAVGSVLGAGQIRSVPAAPSGIIGCHALAIAPQRFHPMEGPGRVLEPRTVGSWPRAPTAVAWRSWPRLGRGGDRAVPARRRDACSRCELAPVRRTSHRGGRPASIDRDRRIRHARPTKEPRRPALLNCVLSGSRQPRAGTACAAAANDHGRPPQREGTRPTSSPSPGHVRRHPCGYRRQEQDSTPRTRFGGRR